MLSPFLQGAMGLKMINPIPGIGNLQIVPQDSVSSEQLHSNIDANRKLMSRWLKLCDPWGGGLTVISGGDNAQKHLPLIKKLDKLGNKSLVVKHALPWLHRVGYNPWGVILLDPRPVTGISTHGIVRTELFSCLPKKSKIFIASMSSPTVTEFILDLVEKQAPEDKCEIWGWHAWTDGAKDYKLPPGEHWISGGTCAAWRTIGMGQFLGFANYDLFGFDLCIWDFKGDLDEKDYKDRPKHLKVFVGLDRKEFISTPELMAAAQDANIILMDQGLNARITVHGEGIVPEIAKQINRPQRQKFELLFP